MRNIFACVQQSACFIVISWAVVRYRNSYNKNLIV